MRTVILMMLLLVFITPAKAVLASDWSQNAFGYAEIKMTAGNGSATKGSKNACRVTAVNAGSEIVLATSGHCVYSAERGSDLASVKVKFNWGNISVDEDQIVVFYGNDSDIAVIYLPKEQQETLRPYALPLAGLPAEGAVTQLVSAQKKTSKPLAVSDCKVMLRKRLFETHDLSGRRTVTRSDFAALCDKRKQLNEGYSGSALVSAKGYHGQFFISVPNGAFDFNAAFSVLSREMIEQPIVIASLN